MAISLSCPSCEHKLKVKDELAGRKVRCPECGKGVPVPGLEEEEEETPVRKRRPDDDEDEDDRPRKKSRAARQEEDEDDRPRKKKKKKPNLGLIIGLSAGGAALLVGGVILFFVIGIGSGPRRNITVENDFKQLGLAFHNHIDDKKKAPAQAEDLRLYLEGGNNPPFQKLQSGEYVLIWNVHFRDMTAGSSNTILGYEKDAPAKGGAVLFGDASVRTMTVEEFRKTPKAQAAAQPTPQLQPKDEKSKTPPQIDTKKPPLTSIGRVMEKGDSLNFLKQIGLAYHQYLAESNRGPSKWQDLSPHYGKLARIDEALSKKWVTFIYEVSTRQMPEGSSNTILAYETDADTVGIRVVLMGDGSVREMTVSEFNKTPKAKGK